MLSKRFSVLTLEALVLDKLLEAVDNLEPALLVASKDIAGLEPAALGVGSHGLLSGLRVVEVALHDARAPHPELSGLALRRVQAILLDKAGLPCGDELADAAAPAVLVTSEGGDDGRSLSEACRQHMEHTR